MAKEMEKGKMMGKDPPAKAKTAAKPAASAKPAAKTGASKKSSMSGLDWKM